ncbi:MAG: N-acetylmuramoyl-L-alanine amidase family protein [Clostridiales bacterium]|nr:N-acetylmuramoyl-L-alanine amidase family protein [Clostridiales bacterium]
MISVIMVLTFCIFAFSISVVGAAATSTSTSQTSTTNNVSKSPTPILLINGTKLQSDVPPVIINSRTLVPARAVFEKLGAVVTWDSKKRKVLVELGEKSVLLTIDDDIAFVNDQEVKLDVPAKIINGRTMIPLRFVGEQLNLAVGWNGITRTVTIDKVDKSKLPSILKDVKCLEKENQAVITLSVNNFTEVTTMRLSSPGRMVFDFHHTTLQSGYEKISILGKFVKAVRCAQFDEQTTRVVVDMEGELEFNTENGEGLYTIYLYRPGENLGNDNTGTDGTTTEGNSTGGTSTTGGTGTTDETGTAGGSGTTGGTSGTTDSTNTTEGTGTTDGTGTSGDIGNRGEDDRSEEFKVEYKKVSETAETIEISTSNTTGYKFMRLTGPNRIVLDIPDNRTEITLNKLDIAGAIVKLVRYTRFDDNTIRVVLDVDGQPSFNTREEAGKLILELNNPKYKNIKYHNNGDRVYFTLSSAMLTVGGENLSLFYQANYDETGKIYSIKFPSNLADLGNGEMVIGDGLIDKLVVATDDLTGQTEVAIHSPKRLIYQIIAREETQDTAITVIDPASFSDRLVVLDAGHGGADPGAVYGTLHEKEFNLDIAFRVNKLLEKYGIKTYMTREDDTYIGLYERAYIANSLNAALFLSIHNNAINDPDYRGTMTLYYPLNGSTTGFNGKRFAGIIQEYMLASLGTVDKKVIERPNLVVLRATSMPAALSEVVVMTNKSDRALLITEEFRQKAAEALCNAVLEALTELN